MYALLDTVLFVLDLYKWIVICAVIGSWLLNFGVINRYNRLTMQIIDMLERLTEPALRPIRRIVPDLGGVDISPLILLVIIFFLERLIAYDLAPALHRAAY